jgi:hypothetical protein
MPDMTTKRSARYRHDVPYDLTEAPRTEHPPRLGATRQAE